MPERDFAGWSRAILAALWRAGSALSTAELASELGVDASTLTPLLRRMAERGLIDDEPLAGRGRRWYPVSPSRKRSPTPPQRHTSRSGR